MISFADINTSPKEKAKLMYRELALKNNTDPIYEAHIKRERALNELRIQALTEGTNLLDEEKEWWKKVLVEYKKLGKKTLWDKVSEYFKKPYKG